VVQHVVLVDPDGSGAESVGNTDGGVEVGGVDGGSEAVVGVVADADGVGFVGELGDGADRAKDFLLHDFHVFGHVGEDGGLDEVTFVAVALAADFDFGAFFLAVVNVAVVTLVVWEVCEGVEGEVPHDTIVLELRNLRTLESVRAKGVADNILLSALLESLDEFIVDAILDVDS